MVSFTNGPVVVLAPVGGTAVVPSLPGGFVVLEPVDPLELLELLELHAATASASTATVVANRSCMPGILAGGRMWIADPALPCRAHERSRFDVGRHPRDRAAGARGAQCRGVDRRGHLDRVRYPRLPGPERDLDQGPGCREGGQHRVLRARSRAPRPDVAEPGPQRDLARRTERRAPGAHRPRAPRRARGTS